MSLSQYRWVLAATVVSESSWLFSLLGMVALALARDGSPLGWLAMLSILGLSVVVGRLSPSNVAAIEAVYLVRTLIGAIIVYLTVATQVGPGIDLTWVAKLMSEGAPDGYAFRGIAGSIVGVLLWWRGGRLTVVEEPTDSLGFSFRLGVLVFALTTVVDIANPADLYTFPMIFIFFAAGLGGLSIGHLLPESEQSAEAKIWPKVIGGLVVTVLFIGLLVSLLQRGALSYLSNLALAALNAVVQGILWGIVIPIAYVFNLIMNAVIALFDGAFAGVREGPSETRFRTAQEFAEAVEQQEEEGAALFSFVIQIVEWVFLAVIALFLLFLLGRAFSRLLRRRPEQTMGMRESIKEDANPFKDIASLLSTLTPDWLRPGGGRKSFALPHGPPGIVEVLRIYYDLLRLAEVSGIQRRSCETATEFQSALERVLPAELVRMITGAFNRALYGHHPATEEQIAQMRASLKGLTSRLV